MKILPLLVTFSLSAPLIAMAQTCPSTIQGVSQLKQNIPEWKVDPSEGTFNLGGVSIIEGPMNSSAEGIERELVPMEKNGIQFWRFTNTVGSNEVWMRCWYSGTALSWSARIHADVIECFRRSGPDPKIPRKEKVVVMCVNASQRSVKH